MRKVEIEGVNFSFFRTWKELDEVIEDVLAQNVTQMIFACDSRSLFESKSNSELKSAYSDARIVLADGKPIYWCGRSDDEIHVTGPNLMDYLLNSVIYRNKSHYFVGGPEQTVKDLHNQSIEIGVNVVGSYCPPFSNISRYNWEEITRDINESSPDFIWIGLGAPKQELFAVKLSKLINSGIIIGVGLAFDYSCGNVQKPPKYISAFGFEWFWRYAQQPKRITRFVLPFFHALKLLVKYFVFNKVKV